MLFKKKKPLVRIEHGQDEAGRPLMRLQTDQERNRDLTGSYLADPVIPPTDYMVDKDMPIDKAWTDAGWFRPSDPFRIDVTNYNLKTMYKPDSVNLVGHCGSLDTADVGRLGVTIAEMAVRKDGSIELKLPSVLPEYLPEKSKDCVRDVQDAATELGRQGKTESLREIMAIISAERGPMTSEIHKECDLRMVMHNQKIYRNYATTEEIRKEGIRVNRESTEMHEAAMLGKAVEELSHIYNDYDCNCRFAVRFHDYGPEWGRSH